MSPRSSEEGPWLPPCCVIAAVAGRFYPGDPDDLRAEAHAYLSQASSTNQAPLRALGCIAPHAGYMYSGHVAGAVFARMEVPEALHRAVSEPYGMGRALAIMSEGAWQTPLGDVPIDAELACRFERRDSLPCRKILRRIAPSMLLKWSFPSCCCGSRS